MHWYQYECVFYGYACILVWMGVCKCMYVCVYVCLECVDVKV